MAESGMSADRADAVATYLAFVMDKVMDRNSAFSSWAATREKIRGDVSRPDSSDAVGLLRELSVPGRNR